MDLKTTQDKSREALDAELLQWWDSSCENMDNLRPIVDNFEAYGRKQALEEAMEMFAPVDTLITHGAVRLALLQKVTK